MAVHSYSVLKERFAETRSLHRHDAEQQVWAVPNKLLQGKGLFVYTKTLLAGTMSSMKQKQFHQRRLYGCADFQNIVIMF